MTVNQTSSKGAEAGVTINVKVIPRAKSNSISGFMADGRLKIRLTAPPVDGKANAALIHLLANTLGIPETSISIESGDHAQKKRVKIIGVSAEELQDRLGAHTRT